MNLYFKYFLFEYEGNFTILFSLYIDSIILNKIFQLHLTIKEIKFY